MTKPTIKPLYAPTAEEFEIVESTGISTYLRMQYSPDFTAWYQLSGEDWIEVSDEGELSGYGREAIYQECIGNYADLAPDRRHPRHELDFTCSCPGCGAPATGMLSHISLCPTCYSARCNPNAKLRRCGVAP